MDDTKFIYDAEPQKGLMTFFATKLSHENSMRSVQWSQIARLTFVTAIALGGALHSLPTAILSTDPPYAIKPLTVVSASISIAFSLAAIALFIITTWPDRKLLLFDLTALKNTWEQSSSVSGNAQAAKQRSVSTVAVLNLANTADYLQLRNRFRNRVIRYAYICTISAVILSGIAYTCTYSLGNTTEINMAESSNNQQPSSQPSNNSSGGGGESTSPSSTDNAPPSADVTIHVPSTIMERSAASNRESTPPPPPPSTESKND